MFVLLRLAFLAGLAAAGRVTMEEGNAARASNDWLVHSRCPPATTLPLTLVLRKESAQLAALEDVFWAVSDPSSPRYGEHLNATQLAALIGASDAAIAEVVAWLRREGATHTKVAATRDAIEASLSCAAAERAFDTRLSTLRHSRAGHLAIHRATAPYSLPDAIARHVALVGELIAVPLLRTPLPASNATQLVEEREGGFPTADSCGGKCRSTFVTPAVLSKAYNLGAAPSSAQGSLAVAEFQGVKYDDADLQAYSSACGVDLKVTDVGSAEGFKCRIPLLGTELCGEALLDIEYAGALAGAIPLTDIFNSQFSLLKWATQISNMASPPLVHSVSYGNDEAQQSSKTFMEECNTQFMKLGAMGLSILFASGDQGVLGREGSGSRYHPDFPAASPYITAVGGTDFVTTGVIGAEKAWSQGGGGFSDAFPMPAYQKEAVEAYLASPDLPPSAKWNPSGRGYPDVAALGGQGNPYCIRAGSMFAGVAGTSASCPVVAAVIAKLNELRLAKGGKPLGFLNPWIYSVGKQGFNDVSEGRNCGSALCLPTAGFPAVKGWDAATGFGTPNFELLAKLV